MAKAMNKDKYVNLAAVDLTMSAANALTFQQLMTGISIFERMAWEIYCVEYHVFAAVAEEMTATLDAITVGLSRSDTAATIIYTDPALIDYYAISHIFTGFTPATSHFFPGVITRSFVEMYGGPLIVLPNPLYAYMTTAGLASAGQMRCRIFFKSIQMTPSDYVELIEASRIVG